MSASLWGAHTSRVPAMTSSSSRTCFSKREPGRRREKDCFGEDAATSARDTCAPQITVAAQLNEIG